MKNEFKNLVFYEIYPTSFYDTNGDGIGDLRGIENKLDYVKNLGCNAIWLNPFYRSPFRDGGYDIEDFFDVDPRFGTLDDFKSLIKTAHQKGIKIIVDLVAGHASIDNKDFIKSSEPKRNDKSDLFIWNNCVWDLEPGLRLISGMYRRNACYLVNFFAHQPAFNYGFNRIDYPWQMSFENKRTYQAREYMINVMRFWLSLGADGFRVDMADSLVKNDDSKDATIKVWNYMFSIIRKEYPDAFFVSEWSNPTQSFKAGFDSDFVLDHWDNFYHRLVRSNEHTRGQCAFNGGGDIDFIMSDLRYHLEEAKNNKAYLGLISGNHDTPRIADSLDEQRLKMFYLLLLSMPGIPFILYGDELMMKTMSLDSKDGGFQRTGVRIPMIWNDDKNHGFSNTTGETYLPFYEENKISVEKAVNDKSSLYNYIKDLIKIRLSEDDLVSFDYELYQKDRVIYLKRGKSHELVLNLSNNDVKVDGSVVKSSMEMKDNILKPYSAVLVRK